MAGFSLHLPRDNKSLTRQTSVELNLEPMMNAEIHDDMQRAINTGAHNQNRLNESPASPRVAHSYHKARVSLKEQSVLITRVTEGLK